MILVKMKIVDYGSPSTLMKKFILDAKTKIKMNKNILSEENSHACF